MSEICYACGNYEREVSQLRSMVSVLEREVDNFANEVREKDNRIYELEGALEAMRRDLRRVEDGADLDHAKRTGRSAIGGFW